MNDDHEFMSHDNMEAKTMARQRPVNCERTKTRCVIVYNL